ncbi:response regulator transcription factor [Tessaracoccus caeni]|uniref:response regulator transcription factor n=1 Tax=Tessaracoccus caeni TaxID=3031239 RepID=UPI0023DC8663|nr:response regulator transcription factor [Tessaracoccus caeni]MDF1488268.1 response regulator transcription factor [Tessaracoccus caeni]
MIRVGICEDDKTTLRGIIALLRETDGIQVATIAETGETAIAAQENVDVWLVDVQLPGISGIEVCRNLRERKHPAKIILMTSFPGAYVLDAFHNGADGFIDKTADSLSIPVAVQAAFAGYSVGSRILTAALRQHLDQLAIIDPQRAAHVAPTEPDRTLIRLMRTNATIEEMAAAIHFSESGVKKRLSKMFRRAGVKDQRGLMNWLYDATRAPEPLSRAQKA